MLSVSQIKAGASGIAGNSFVGFSEILYVERLFRLRERKDGKSRKDRKFIFREVRITATVNQLKLKQF
jgi:hypothetical protein